jgi:O-antigen/teichoic acid export membrane protein
MTALAINVSFGLIGSIIIYFVAGHFLLSVHGLSAEVSGELQAVIGWIAPILPLTLAAGISIGALDAHERFLTSNVLQVSSNAIGQVVPLVVAIFVSPHLTAVIPALFGARLLTTFALLGFNIMEFNTLDILNFDKASARKLIHFGGWVTVTNLVSPLMSTLDQFVVGGILGVRSVAYYSVSMTAATRLQLFSGTIARTLFPVFSRVDRHEALEVASSAIVTLSFVSMLVYAPALSALNPLFTLWLGKSFAVSAIPIAAVLFVGAWFNGLAIIPYSLIQGQGRPDLVSKVHVCEVLPYFAVLWLFVHWIGILGVALAWSLRVTIDFVVLWLIAKVPIRIFVGVLPGLGLVVCGLSVNILAPYLNWTAQFGFSAAILLTGLIFWITQDPKAKSVISLIEARLRP